MRLKYIILYVFLLNVVSCVNCDQNNSVTNDVDTKSYNKSLEEVNRQMLKYESVLIEEYIKANELDVVKTGTGLRYSIINQGEGDVITKGNVVTLEYELSLLSGDLMYSSNIDGCKRFLVGRGGVESGLEEAVMLLRYGSEAIFILPSHLGHGLLGDGSRIPPKAILVYKVKVVDVE